jgi:hypothetical protein
MTVTAQVEGWLLELRATFDRLRNQYDQSQISGGYSILPDGKKLVQAVLTPWYEPKLPAEELRTFSSFVLFRRRLSIDNHWNSFEALVRTGAIPVPDIGELMFGGSLETPAWYSSSKYPFYSLWPMTIAKLSATNDARVVHGKLSSPVSGVYPGPNEALSEWTGVDPSFGGWGPVVYFALPDFRARISSVEIGTESVRVKVKSRAPAKSKFSLHFYAASPEQRAIHGRVPIQKSVTRCGVGYVPSTFIADLYLAGEATPIDSREYAAQYSIGPGDVRFSNPPEEDLRNRILGGESVFVEFKEKLPSNELPETVCAFANAKGGTIFIGIRDNAAVCGFADPKYAAPHIDNVIAANVDPVPPYQVRFIRIEGRPVTVIEIREGPDKPYVLRERGVFIRSNATDRVATRFETMELAKPKKEPSRWN